ncbi:MAG: hypothetical protein OIF50_06345 [Flavobacteriaceae bacterium]|nr:hypothetical protein [Flavobacteriaceae bacterium]
MIHFPTIWLLLQRQLKENSRIYSIGIVVLLALLLLMFLVVHQWRDSFSGAVQNGVFLIGLFISGGLFSSHMLGEISKSSSGMWFLAIPAKASEKVIAAFCICIFLFLGCFLLLYYFSESIYLFFIQKWHFENMLHPFKNGFYQLFFLYISLSGVILLGNVLFGAYSFIKTLLAGILLLMVFGYANGFILQLLLPEVNILSSMAFDHFLFAHLGENIKVSLDPVNNWWSSLFVRGFFPLAIWVAVWLKLKEKEIG